MKAINQILGYSLTGAFLLLATANASFGADRYANIHSVAIVSVLGDGILLEQKADVTLSDVAPSVVFDSKLELDNFVTKAVTDAVSSRFKVIVASIDPSMLKAFAIPSDVLAKISDRYVTGEAVPVDAFIVIHPDTWNVQTPIGALSYAYSGTSLMHIKGMFGGYDTILSVQYTVTVLDAKTGKVIDYGTANLASPNFLRNPKPFLFCDGKLWPNDLANPSDTVANQLRTDVMAVMNRSLPIALESANLIGKAADLNLGITPGRVCKSEWF